MIKTETKTLVCLLTEPELIERGEEMAKTYLQVAALDLEKKRITARIKPLDERIEILVTILDTKEEERQVECRWDYDFGMGIKCLYRGDTGEEIDSKAIKDWEYQQQLPIDGATPDPKNLCHNTGCLQFNTTSSDHCMMGPDGRKQNGFSEVTGCAFSKGDAALPSEVAGDDEPVHVCIKTDCAQYNSEEPNGCEECAYVEECDEAIIQGVSNAGPETEEAAEGGEAGNEVAGAATGGGAAELVTQCATCQGLCGDFTPGTQVTECPGFDCRLSTEQRYWRDSTCADWHDCAFSVPCFGPANEESSDCLKHLAQEKPDIFALVKANRAAGMDLRDAVTEASKSIPPEFACKICGFDGKSLVYLKRHLTESHNMGWVAYKKAYPAMVSPDTLAAMREKRAKLIKNKGAK